MAPDPGEDDRGEEPVSPATGRPERAEDRVQRRRIRSVDIVEVQEQEVSGVPSRCSAIMGLERLLERDARSAGRMARANCITNSRFPRCSCAKKPEVWICRRNRGFQRPE